MTCRDHEGDGWEPWLFLLFVGMILFVIVWDRGCR